ncbi:transposon-encoded TnpW family protein [Campylobacter hyointestinalis]|uniref:transposon-encoded TnpW family protein n=1 Tax=Campylobacter hyointestinalis TaxID=198 RepID=UPI000CE51821|nr:transposon-encoded TnpW family protein [Campylobacter hyointestinalis]PPB73718.1 hypothetical protein CDQ79_02125 [Campylobacter hyointestinalis subsp. hyointestinalis]PPB75319.1 hypothetical protein CDQ80_02110 [Campylobacter hyointestinalis subsp. hyointestinalis]PPB76979.1 hypothetical protein CDQ81_03920 [Campylobacter hyointestinalis subsp. hyointestinalis]PPB79072.1 hypothetical protein CDQ82_00235 [Campylobacter hyointestinalis subsp. hyointestinalis]
MIVKDFNNSNAAYYETLRQKPFHIKVGGTTYEVTTHFSDDGKQCILQQFKDLILSEKLLAE